MSPEYGNAYPIQLQTISASQAENMHNVQLLCNHWLLKYNAITKCEDLGFFLFHIGT